MLLTNYYGYKRVSDFSSQGIVYDHKGHPIQQKTDLPIIVINWLNGQMIARETDALPIDEMNKAQADIAELQALAGGQEEAMVGKAAIADVLPELVKNMKRKIKAKKAKK